MEQLTYIQLPMADDEDTLPAGTSAANRRANSGHDVTDPDAAPTAL